MHFMSVQSCIKGLTRAIKCLFVSFLSSYVLLFKEKTKKKKNSHDAQSVSSLSCDSDRSLYFPAICSCVDPSLYLQVYLCTYDYSFVTFQCKNLYFKDFISAACVYYRIYAKCLDRQA